MKTYCNDHVTVTMDCSVHLLQQTWVGVPTSRHFREASWISIQLAQQHQAKRWLIDLRLLRQFSPIDLHWFVQEWLSDTVQHLPQSVYVAVILREPHQFGKLGADLLLRAAMRVNKALASRYFLDEDDARQWLLA